MSKIVTKMTKCIKKTTPYDSPGTVVFLSQWPRRIRRILLHKIVGFI